MAEPTGGSFLRRHRWFLVALTLGVLVRIVVALGFFPALLFSDGPTYLLFIQDAHPGLDRPAGYGVVVLLLHQLTPAVGAIVAVQHMLGVLMAILVYALLRRWGVASGIATLATVPMLFDAMALLLEHAVLSDVVFVDFLVVAVCCLAWRRRPTVPAAAIAGVVFAAAVLTRVVGEPALLSAVVFCLLAAPNWRRRMATVVALCVGFVVPLAAYAGWFHSYQGTWGITSAGGRALYMRTTTFVDCARFTMPAYQKRLCPKAPVGERHDPTFYGWHDPDKFHDLSLPAGVSYNQAFGDFARRAIRAQPGDYLRVVGRDALATFAPTRVDRDEYDTAGKWRFSRYASQPPTQRSVAAYTAYGGDQFTLRQPFADLMVSYERVVYAPGPLLAALLVLAAAGLVWRRPRDAPETRPLIVLTATLGVGLALVPVVTAEFVWRYTLPMLPFVPMAAALAWTRLRNRVSRALAPLPGSTDRTAE